MVAMSKKSEYSPTAFILLVLVFIGATIIYSFIALALGFLEKIEFAFSLGLLVLLVIFYVLWVEVKKRAKIPGV